MIAKKNIRQSKYELLRIVAMLMIITLHYLDKGNVLPQFSTSLGITGYSAWTLEALCIVSVNVYVLISGYFGFQKQGFSLFKVMELWLEILFYSVAIGGICLLTGVISLETINIYTVTEYLFPVLTEQYWFGTAFILLLLFMPFLNAGIRELSQKQFAQILVILLVLNSISKTFLPIYLPLDKYGYDVIWFVCVYLVGAYIGRFGFIKLKKAWHFALLYLLSVGGILFMEIIFRTVFERTGKLEPLLGTSFQYNQILCLTGALGLLGLFGFLKIKEGKVASVINKIAGATFGVYLIHEHKDIRYLWPSWFHTGELTGVIGLFIHWILTILCVFFVCAMLDLIRQFLSYRILKNFHK